MMNMFSYILDVFIYFSLFDQNEKYVKKVMRVRILTTHLLVLCFKINAILKLMNNEPNNVYNV